MIWLPNTTGMSHLKVSWYNEYQLKTLVGTIIRMSFMSDIGLHKTADGFLHNVGLMHEPFP